MNVRLPWGGQQPSSHTTTDGSTGRLTRAVIVCGSVDLTTEKCVPLFHAIAQNLIGQPNLGDE